LKPDNLPQGNAKKARFFRVKRVGTNVHAVKPNDDDTHNQHEKSAGHFIGEIAPPVVCLDIGIRIE
jgi:hypothetical protein